MNKDAAKITIIGAGVSGLVAAKVLEEAGHAPLVIEASDCIGGRVKTDEYNGFPLDHGFQVLLTAYPEAKKHLDFKALDLHRFLPGTVVFTRGKRKLIGDPLRHFPFLFPSLTSGIGTFMDQLKILKLSRRLKQKSIGEVFSTPEVSTMTYLKELGFSNEMIKGFFKPFYSGIFLETNLETSSRMFEFVFKMFAQGEAAVPKIGMKAIPEQLAGALKATKFQYNTKVLALDDQTITLNDGRQLNSDYVIVATERGQTSSELDCPPLVWRKCHVLYFETKRKQIDDRLIGLVSQEGALVNNIVYLPGGDAKGEKEMLSVTVVDDQNLPQKKMENKVVKELEEICGITEVKLVKCQFIKKALPHLRDLKHENDGIQISDHVFAAGDTVLNGSLNAAMKSGEQAAIAVLAALAR